MRPVGSSPLRSLNLNIKNVEHHCSLSNCFTWPWLNKSADQFRSLVSFRDRQFPEACDPVELSAEHGIGTIAQHHFCRRLYHKVVDNVSGQRGTVRATQRRVQVRRVLTHGAHQRTDFEVLVEHLDLQKKMKKRKK